MKTILRLFFPDIGWYWYVEQKSIGRGTKVMITGPYNHKPTSKLADQPSTNNGRFHFLKPKGAVKPKDPNVWKVKS